MDINTYHQICSLYLSVGLTDQQIANKLNIDIIEVMEVIDSVSELEFA